MGRHGTRAGEDPHGLRPLARGSPALPHRGACPLAGSPGGRPIAAERVNPSGPVGSASAVPLVPVAPRSLRGPRATETGKVLGRAGLRPEGSVIRAQVSQPRWGPILLLLGCVTLGNRPYLPEPPPLVFSAVKKKMSDVTPALPNPFPSTCQVPRGVRVPHCLLTARGAVMIMGFQKRKPAQSPEGPPKVTQQESHRAGI